MRTWAWFWAIGVVAWGLVPPTKLRPFLPIMEAFVEPILPTGPRVTTIDGFRVLQLNMLADGLSGLRRDLGAFSRAKASHMKWDKRKLQLIQEILQYAPDLITLQECDHYYDFFLPELSALGYDGLFAPKPASACLEVSENSDGCAIFLKRGKFRVTSTETVTFALAKCQVTQNREREEDQQIRAQNQIALVALCELANATHCPASSAAPQVIICTTHLKATKNLIGEKTRQVEVLQLLAALSELFEARKAEAQLLARPEPIILLTGDLNAAPNDVETGFEALAYSAVKDSPLRLRSVLNDDITAGDGHDALDVWTTWKARKKKGKEAVAKSCIDYILYRPLQAAHAEAASGGASAPIAPIVPAGLRARAILKLFNLTDIGAALLPSESYPSDHVAIAADLEVVVQWPSEASEVTGAGSRRM